MRRLGTTPMLAAMLLGSLSDANAGWRAETAVPTLLYDGPYQQKKRGKPVSKRTAPKRKRNRAKGRKPKK